MDSLILLVRLLYAMANFTDTLQLSDKAQIGSLEEKQLPARSWWRLSPLKGFVT